MQADAYSGFNRLYQASRKGGPIIEALCWAHARRKFFDLARVNKAPIAIEAVERIDALFAIERDITGKPPPERQRVRNEHSRPLVTGLETWLRKQRARLSARNAVAKAWAVSFASATLALARSAVSFAPATMALVRWAVSVASATLALVRSAFLAVSMCLPLLVLTDPEISIRPYPRIGR